MNDGKCVETSIMNVAIGNKENEIAKMMFDDMCDEMILAAEKQGIPD